MDMVRVRVADIVDEAENIKSFRLERTDGEKFAAYPAGAHIDVVGPTAVVRQYSLCGEPDDGAYRIAVKLEPESRGGSEALHGLVHGAELEVGEPRSLLAVEGPASRHVLVAAGIGVTPLLSIAYHLKAANEAFELHYFARSRQEAAFVALLERSFSEAVSFHFGVQRVRQAEVLEEVLRTLEADARVYTCGPQGFMDRVSEIAARSVGVHRVHMEHFRAEDVDTSHDVSFEVELDTGGVFTVPADRTIVQVLEENGIDVGTSCREGICGTCVMGVLAGVPEHRDNCLSVSERAANDRIAACVSRARSPRLVLELF